MSDSSQSQSRKQVIHSQLSDMGTQNTACSVVLFVEKKSEILTEGIQFKNGIRCTAFHPSKVGFCQNV